MGDLLPHNVYPYVRFMAKMATSYHDGRH